MECDLYTELRLYSYFCRSVWESGIVDKWKSGNFLLEGLIEIVFFVNIDNLVEFVNNFMKCLRQAKFSRTAKIIVSLVMN